MRIEDCSSSSDITEAQAANVLVIINYQKKVEKESIVRKSTRVQKGIVSAIESI